jgi:hypothetical protein
MILPQATEESRAAGKTELYNSRHEQVHLAPAVRQPLASLAERHPEERRIGKTVKWSEFCCFSIDKPRRGEWKQPRKTRDFENVLHFYELICMIEK